MLNAGAGFKTIYYLTFYFLTLQYKLLLWIVKFPYYWDSVLIAQYYYDNSVLSMLSLATKRKSFVLAKITTLYQTIKLLHQCTILLILIKCMVVIK